MFMYATSKHDVKAKNVKWNKDMSVHPDIFIENQSERDSDALHQNIEGDRCKYETWKKFPISSKSKSGEKKVVRKMKL